MSSLRSLKRRAPDGHAWGLLKRGQRLGEVEAFRGLYRPYARQPGYPAHHRAALHPQVRGVPAPGGFAPQQASLVEGLLLPRHSRSDGQLRKRDPTAAEGEERTDACTANGAKGPLLEGGRVTLQYKTREHIGTAIYRVSFQV